MLAEPARTPYDVNFWLGEIPVRIHPGFWLFTLIMGSGAARSWQPAVIWLMASFVCILFHELGHALMQRAFGESSRIVLYAGGGLAIASTRGWRDMRSQVLISLAGPFAGFLLAIATIVGLRLSGEPASLFFAWPKILDYHIPKLDNLPLAYLVVFSMFINVTWGLVNLIPVYPLDGGQAMRAILTHYWPREGLRYSLIVSIAAGIAVALYAYERHDNFLLLFFGYLAFQSYLLLQQQAGPRSPW